LRKESHNQHRYRITRTDGGILMSCAMKSELLFGAVIPVDEGLRAPT